jgi:uncharacterized hydrophobic protein (TIGR00271 family)
MLHVRVISPSSLTDETVRLLEASPAVTHLWVSNGSARKPEGDVVSCDVAREAATGIIGRLQELGLSRNGAIIVERLDIILSASAERAERDAPGLGADALVWEELEQNAGEETRLSVVYLTFMVVAMLIASIGVLLDQPILIVGAMVVGPEFGPLVALCVSVVARRPRQARAALSALLLGFLIGMLATVVFTWALTLLGLVDKSMLTGERPLTSFIWQPDALSWIVGFLAGVAGVLALTSAKSGALVGVLISVTTIPAAANAAVAVAYWVPAEAVGSAIQLLIKLRHRAGRRADSPRAALTSESLADSMTLDGLVVVVRARQPFLRFVQVVGFEDLDLARHQPTERLDAVLQPIGIGDDRHPLPGSGVSRPQLGVGPHGARRIGVEIVAEDIQEAHVGTLHRTADGGDENASVILFAHFADRF